jgi:hypothetical protein
MATRPQREPAQLVAASTVHLARELHRATSVQGLLDTPVLIPNVEDHAVLPDLDRVIIDYLPSLTAVCSQPHDRLTVEQVLVRAPLARRVPVAGLMRLASHSEDWATVEFNRVIPQRLQARRYVDDYDFYENQVAAQLVDRLHRYLSGRLHDLSTLERHIMDLSKYEYALQGPQSHWKRQKLATLLTEATGTQGQAAPIKDALRQLKELHAQVNLLRGSPLYQHVNRRTTIPFRLPRTNLLTRDRRYHRTALLWEAWALCEANDTMTRQEYRHHFPPAYVAYVTAIVLRAYRILGLVPADSTAQLREPWDSTIELVSANVRLFMQVKDSGVIEMRSGDRAVVRVVPLDVDLTAERSPVKAREALASVFHDCEAVVTPTVIVYPGQRELRATLPADLQRLLHTTGPLPPDSGPQRHFSGSYR